MSLESRPAPRYGCCVEDESSWLPPGLEGPGPEPDDRASQRAELKAGGRRSKRAPDADADAGDSPQKRRKDQGSEAEPGKKEAPERSAAPEGSEARDAKPVKSERRDPEPSGAGNGESRPARREANGDRGPQARSDVDAMGQEKHRKVVGQRYGLSRARQFLFYGLFLAFVVVAYIGLKAAVDSLDKAPAHDKDQAPWSKPGAPQGPLGGFEPSHPGQKGPTHFQ